MNHVINPRITRAPHTNLWADVAAADSSNAPDFPGVDAKTRMASSPAPVAK